MGLFDRLLGNAAKKAINEAIDNVTGHHTTSTPSTPAYTPQSNYEPVPQDPVEIPVDQKLDKILTSEFPSYQVQKNVDPRSMGATDTHLIPYAYVISANGQAKLIIMLPGKNTCSTRAYRFAKAFAESRGITLINFLLDSPNEESYIIGRLHQYL
ncbi:MAG: hypothetical protein J5379_06610 [Clostridiales bacterium]|nr:hypothetical protein [Clostridiales bacterium]